MARYKSIKKTKKKHNTDLLKKANEDCASEIEKINHAKKPLEEERNDRDS